MHKGTYSTYGIDVTMVSKVLVSIVNHQSITSCIHYFFIMHGTITDQRDIQDTVRSYVCTCT